MMRSRSEPQATTGSTAVAKGYDQEFMRQMHHHPLPITQQLHVIAQFGGREQSFDLAHNATLAQLAEHLAGLARENDGWPSDVSIVFDKSSKPTCAGPLGQTKVPAAWLSIVR